MLGGCRHTACRNRVSHLELNITPSKGNTKGSKSTTRAVLNGFELLALVGIIRDRYVSSGLDNSAFARTVNDTPSERKEFRFDVNQSHIKSTLEICRIEPNRTRKAKVEPADTLALIARVQHLEVALDNLQREVQALIRHTNLPL